MTRLEFDRVTVRRRGRELVSAVTLEVRTGELVALVGPNGAGKTTLLRAALGLLPLDAGRVTVDGEDVTKMSPRDRAGRLAWLPQTGSVSEPMSVGEHVAAARYRLGESLPRARQAAVRALERVGAEPLADRALASLSGGERQRVALAAVLAQEAPLLLLDEPANHLDPRQQRDTFQRIGAVVGEGLGALCVTHDVGLLAALPSGSPVRVVGLDGGHLAFDLGLDDPALPVRLGELFGLPVTFVEQAGCRALVTWWHSPAAPEAPCA